MIEVRAGQSHSERPGIETPIPGRILFICTTRHDGGVERVGVRLAGALATAAGGALPPVFAARPGSFIAESCARLGIEVAPYAPRNSGDLASAWRLAGLIRRVKPSVVHAHSRRDYLPAALGVDLARRMGHDSRLFFHCHLVRALGDPPGLSGRFFARRVDRFLAVSQSVRSDLLARHRAISPDQVVVLPNGIDLDRVVGVGERAREEVRRSLGIPPDSLVIGMVGRLDAKGQRHLVAAAPALKAAFPAPIRFLFVGGEGPAGYEAELRRLASERGAEEEMILTGVQEEVAPYLAAMDLFAHLPEDEAFGLAIAEAMAARLPVVASRAPACREIVEEGVTGYLVDAADPARLAQAIAQLAGSAELRARMGTAAFGRATQRYSLASQAARLIELYREAIDKRRTGV